MISCELAPLTHTLLSAMSVGSCGVSDDEGIGLPRNVHPKVYVQESTRVRVRIVYK